MIHRTMFRGRSPDTVTSQVAARALSRLELQHGPLRECTVVIIEAPHNATSVPRYKVSARIDVTYMQSSMTAEPTTMDDELARAVGRALEAGNQMLISAKERRCSGEYFTSATYGGRC